MKKTTLIIIAMLAIVICIVPKETTARNWNAFRNFWVNTNQFDTTNPVLSLKSGTTFTNLATSGDITATGGSFIAATAGEGLQIKEGANAKMGTNALANGTVTVSTTAVTATSRIFLTKQVGIGTTRGILEVGAVVVGTSFVIDALDLSGVASADDDSVVAWMIVEPAP